MKIICFTVYPEEAPSVRTRVGEYRPFLQRDGIDLTIISLLGSRLYATRRRFGWRHTLRKAVSLTWCSMRLALQLPKAAIADVVLIHREVFPLGPPWIEHVIMRLSKRCVYDLDDAIWVPPSNSVNQRALFWDDERIPSILRHTDVAIAGSPYIADYMRRFNANVIEIPTTCNDLNPSGTPAARADGPPVVVWIGNWGNAFYVRQILDALEEAARRVPFVLRLIGGPDIHDIRSDSLRIDYCDWQKDKEGDWLLGADVGIMPLEDSEYERGKCAFKLIQYMSAGLPVMASPVGMNTRLVTPAVGLLPRTSGEWLDGLVKLLADGRMRSTMAAASRQAYLRHYRREDLARRFGRVLRGESESDTI